MKKNKSWLKTFQHAAEGCWYAFRTQRNFKIHFLISLLVLLLAWYFKISKIELLFLTLAITFGLAIETVNTAIETVTDLVTQEFHPLAKIAKDVSAGAMLITSIGLTILAIIIFSSYVI